MISVENKKVINNFLSLSILQALNYVLPLITLPYLIQVLGVDKFGLVTFSASLALYFNVIADYGYKLTAPRDIAQNRNCLDTINEIVSVVLVSKLILLVFGFIVYFIIVFSVESFWIESKIYMLSFLVVVSQSMIPVWFFQGMEDMKYVTVINVITKAIFLILVFLFIKSEGDVYLLPLFTAVGFILTSLFCFYKMKVKYKYIFIKPTLTGLKNSFTNGFHIFVGNASTSLYTNTNIFLLGVLTTTSVVGYYSVAEKIVSAIAGLFIPLNQALYPYLSKKYIFDNKSFSPIIYKLSS
ncbi:oligosaccharide flippase family protein, partial [Photobacterium swingsii]